MSEPDKLLVRVPGSAGLVAEVDGAAVAAISLTSGAVATDRDRSHPGTVQSLRYRRYRILRQGWDVGRADNVLQRLAPARGTRSADRRYAIGGANHPEAQESSVTLNLRTG